MNCPYCGKQMQTGYLQSSRRIIWSPEKKEGIVMASNEGDINFPSGIINGSCVESWHCAGCKKLITEVKEER